MNNKAWLVAAIPFSASTTTHLEALASLPCAFLIYGLCLCVSHFSMRLVACTIALGLYELVLKAISFAAFSDLQTVLPLWLLLAFAPCKALKPYTLIGLSLAALALGAMREISTHAAFLIQAYSWFGLPFEHMVPITAPWLNESAVLMLLVALALAGIRVKGRLQ